MWNRIIKLYFSMNIEEKFYNIDRNLIIIP